MTLPRLRQVVLAVADLADVSAQLESALGVATPFRDDGVGHFGLQNAVYAVGDCFVELVSPLRDDTAAGRYRDRRGGDCGYMAMFETADAAEVRERLARLGVRVVWDTTHDDIVDLHLHPKDVPPAIVALDSTRPTGSWRWGGPDWTGRVPAHGPGGLERLVVATTTPEQTASRWAAVLGVAADGATVALAGGRQRVEMVPVEHADAAGIVGVGLSLAGPSGRARIGGVDLQWTTTEE